MANTVTFKIKIEDTNELKSVTVDTQELDKEDGGTIALA